MRFSVVRLLNLAFQKQGITRPDEARKIVFPSGISVNLLRGKLDESKFAMQIKPVTTELE